jgi:D-amino peptidase
MKLYISVDFEGIAGIVHWEQIMPSGADYAVGRALLMGELNAAIQGAVSAGVTEVTINDAHAQMRNVLPDELEEHVRLVLGHFKPMYMMEGLDSSFDAIFFLGYHGAIGAPQAVLSHTYSPQVIWEARIDGRVTGELGINALVARHYRVPIVLVTGDHQTVREAEEWIPGVTTVAVKDSCGRYAANNISPARARSLIATAAHEAITNLQSQASLQPPDGPVTLDLVFQFADMATLAEWIKGVERSGDRSVRLHCPNGLSAYRMFYTVLLLARNAMDQ